MDIVEPYLIRVQSYALQVMFCGLNLHSFKTILKTRVQRFKQFSTAFMQHEKWIS